MKNTAAPQVAIVTRTKDRPILLNRALKDISDQNYDDFILVIVNDGGDAAAAKSLVANHHRLRDRVKIINIPESVGMQNASNKGIEESDSKYVVIHDDDDSWHRDFLKVTVEHLDKNGSMGVVTVTDIVTEKITGNRITRLKSERRNPDMKHISIYDMCLGNCAAPISFIFRRSVFEDIGYFNQDYRGFGDWDFALRFILKYDIDFLDTEHALAYYHQRPDQSGNDQNSVFSDNQRYLESLMINRYLREDLESGKIGLGYMMSSARKMVDVNWLNKKELEHAIKLETAKIKYEVNIAKDEMIKNLGKHIDELPRPLYDKVQRKFKKRSSQ